MSFGGAEDAVRWQQQQQHERTDRLFSVRHNRCGSVCHPDGKSGSDAQAAVDVDDG